MRAKILLAMEAHEWNLRHPLIHTFWEWVVMPVGWGGRLGLKNWIKYALRGSEANE